MLFTGLFLESSHVMENDYVREFFEVDIKMDVVLLRMVLEVVNNCLKSAEVNQEALDNSAFLNASQRFDKHSILEDIEAAEKE